MSGIVLKAKQMGEKWKECMLGGGTNRKNRWKAVWSSTEEGTEDRLPRRREAPKRSARTMLTGKLSVTVMMAH